MKLEDQVASLKLERKLEMLGVKQHQSIYSWWLNPLTGPYLSSTGPAVFGHERLVDAHTVAELGEMLPKPSPKGSYLPPIQIYDEGKIYWVDPIREIRANTEANARAKMLIHLIEKEVIKI